MSERFNTAEEARKYVDAFRHSNINIAFNQDSARLLNNVVRVVTELSQLEVEARQTRRTHKVDECKVRLDNMIDHLEKLLIIAKLMS
jgi:hypothetical protein